VSLTPKAVFLPLRRRGDVAAPELAFLARAKGRVGRAVLLAPADRRSRIGLVAPRGATVTSHLGPIAVDAPSRQSLIRSVGLTLTDEPFADAAGLPNLLTCLHQALGRISLLPLLVGKTSAAELRRALDSVWAGPETLIVATADVDGGREGQTSSRMAGDIVAAVERLEPKDLGADGVADHRVLGALIETARCRHMRATRVSVGGSENDPVPVAFEEHGDARIDRASRRRLIDIAHAVIGEGIKSGRQPPPPANADSPTLAAARATFVSAFVDNRLRGCVGTVFPHRSLLADVTENAFHAISADRRFDPLSAEEAERSIVEISVMSVPHPIPATDETDLLRQLRPGVDGLFLYDRGRRGLFLPKVWEQLPDPSEFVAHLKQKAGLAADHWSAHTKVSRFVVESFATPDVRPS
jgi:AmmeMemoRadiSam system protein A